MNCEKCGEQLVCRCGQTESSYGVPCNHGGCLFECPKCDRKKEDWLTEREVIECIWRIVHTPSTKHPKGGHAYTHFMADFDEIRRLCKPFINSEKE